MFGITEISSALGGIKVATDMVKGISSLKNETEINQAVINIQRTLLEAQGLALQDREKQAELIEKISNLESEVRKLSAAGDERRRYELFEFPTGAMVYVLRRDSANGEPPHKICTRCFGDGKKSILQVVNRHSGGESVICPSCSQKYTLQPFPKVEVRPSQRNSWMDR